MLTQKQIVSLAQSIFVFVLVSSELDYIGLFFLKDIKTKT